MSKSDSISMSVIRRLPRYYRFLSELNDQKVDRISSTKLAQIMNVTASQVRQDLNCFGGFGQQGYGYSVSQLKDEIKNILGLNNDYKAILIGAGNLGKAVAMHMNFEKLGFELIACFDNNEKKVGQQLNNIFVKSETELDEFCKQNHVDSAFLCIPRVCVENVLDKLYALGIKNYWNFSHYDISAKYSDTLVENVHLSDNLMTLCYRMNNNK
ncbi:redox-sensing transcriptional repressor Rex [Ruminococcus sp.]|uniref:redox-sensing transcriptional repressor Rex n=1 Tax=Ruminococcus sp. TaxID=41978 RepID=UPI0025E98473|nr:redox-sensing transcriptional repressor Rex [Ruminococcus sp.]MCI6615651.1 redox-sensing transcriptional repressor Rex [Ruminococcus sp.]